MARCIRNFLSHCRGLQPKAARKKRSSTRTETPQAPASAPTEYLASWASWGQFWMRCKEEFTLRLTNLGPQRKGAKRQRRTGLVGS